MKAKPKYDNNEIIGYEIKCLGCDFLHIYYTKVGYYKIHWGFNGNLERPTFTPSLLLTTGSFADPNYIDDPEIPPTRCHIVVTDGICNFCNDCTHGLAGQAVELPDFE